MRDTAAEQAPAPGGEPLAAPLAVVTVVEAPGCHFCEDAEQALAEIGQAYPLQLQRVDAASPEGTGLMQRHRAAMSPLVLVDGAFFSSGRLPRGKLRRLLDGRR